MLLRPEITIHGQVLQLRARSVQSNMHCCQWIMHGCVPKHTERIMQAAQPRIHCNQCMLSSPKIHCHQCRPRAKAHRTNQTNCTNLVLHRDECSSFIVIFKYQFLPLCGYHKQKNNLQWLIWTISLFLNCFNLIFLVFSDSFLDARTKGMQIFFMGYTTTIERNIT